MQPVERQLEAIGRRELDGAGQAQSLLVVTKVVRARQAGCPQAIERVGCAAAAIDGSDDGRIGIRPAVAGFVRRGIADGAEAFLLHRAFRIGGGEQNPDHTIGEGIADERGQPGIDLLAQRVVAGLRRPHHGEAGVIEGVGRIEVDRAGDAAFLDRGALRLLHVDPVEQLGREDVEVERATGVDREATRIEPVRTGGHFHAVEGRAGEIGGETAQGDVATFAAFA